MRLLPIALLSAAPALAASIPATPHKPMAQPADCPNTINHHAWNSGKALAPQKLGELPDANAYKAAYRRIRGCEVPVVVRYGIGGR